ncbi:MAG: PD40 domain-containing protein [Sphingobacteriaceae bacterium]|nr:PD40 domain-containing protein [Sphingobacteriaceae bacterium]
MAELDTKLPGKVRTAVNITNRPGYDNQPSFSKNGKLIYFTSIREDKQADVYACSVGSKKITQITKTKESEYSPNETEFGNYLSVLHVTMDSIQTVKLLDLKTFTVTNSNFSSFDSAGYYHFLNADTVLYYKLTQPHSLRYFVNSTNADGFLGEHPCRTFKTVNRHSFMFGVKDSSSTRYFLYDVRLQKQIYTQASIRLMKTWSGILFMVCWSHQATILKYDAAQQKWNVLYDLSSFGIKKITRFCFDQKNKYLVVVNNL